MLFKLEKKCFYGIYLHIKAILKCQIVKKEKNTQIPRYVIARN